MIDQQVCDWWQSWYYDIVILFLQLWPAISVANSALLGNKLRGWGMVLQLTAIILVCQQVVNLFQRQNQFPCNAQLPMIIWMTELLVEKLSYMSLWFDLRLVSIAIHFVQVFKNPVTVSQCKSVPAQHSCRYFGGSMCSFLYVSHLQILLQQNIDGGGVSYLACWSMCYSWHKSDMYQTSDIAHYQ